MPGGARVKSPLVYARRRLNQAQRQGEVLPVLVNLLQTFAQLDKLGE